MARKIVITSGKGGVGKTSITASLGICIAKKGYNVLLIDADVGLNNLDIVLGMENRMVYDLSDVIKNKCTLKQALIQDSFVPSLYILPSQNAFSIEDISADMFRGILLKLDKMFDYILIDSPAGIEKGFHRAVCGADEAIVITTPHVSSIRDADKVISILSGYQLMSISIVVNRLRGDLVVKGAMISALQVSNVLRKMLIGQIPEDDSISIYGQLGRIDANDSESKKAIELVALYITTGQLKLFDFERKYKNFFWKLRHGI